MKKLVFTIIPVVICGIWFASSCHKESNAESTLNIKAVVYSNEPTPKQERRIIDTLLFREENIEWYNATTREIRFKNIDNTNVFFGLWGDLVSIIVCLDETELFTLGAVSAISSISYDHPVLIDWGSGYYIGRGYPDWEYWTEQFWTDTKWDRAAGWVKEREKNWKAIEPGWNKFIEQLKQDGKYKK